MIATLTKYLVLILFSVHVSAGVARPNAKSRDALSSARKDQHFTKSQSYKHKSKAERDSERLEKKRQEEIQAQLDKIKHEEVSRARQEDAALHRAIEICKRHSQPRTGLDDNPDLLACIRKTKLQHWQTYQKQQLEQLRKS